MDRRIVSRSLCLCVGLLVLLASVAGAQTHIINTVAGGGPNNLPATASAIGTPWKAVQQSLSPNNFFISDPLFNRVFSVDTAGTLRVVAGNILAGYTLDGQAATVATLNKPEGIAIDSSGGLYIADSSNNVVRYVNTNSSLQTKLFNNALTVQPGQIVTIAGDGTPCNGAAPCGDGQLATTAMLTSPSDVWLDISSNIYIADTGDDVVRVVNNQTGIITTVAGNISKGPGYSGDNGPATNAQMNSPSGVFVDGNGNIFIADTSNSVVREVANTSELIFTVAGDFASGPGYSGDGGAATSAQLNNPFGVFEDSQGNIFVADSKNNVVRQFTVGGNITTVAGNNSAGPCSAAPCGDGGAATSAQLSFPTGVFADVSGNLFIGDQNDSAIREVSGGNIHTSMGELLNLAYSGDGNPGTQASLYTPSGTAADAQGNIYIADAQNNVVRVVNNQKNAITVANVAIAGGAIATVAGNGQRCQGSLVSCGDGGAATSAQLYAPSAVALDTSGNIYVADAFDSAIRVVNAQSGVIVTVAGNGSFSFSGDGGPATGAALDAPFGLALDRQGNIYIADGNPPGLTGITSNNVIRVVNRQSSTIKVAGISIGPGNINTVAGTALVACNPSTDPCGDGNPATQARLTSPTGVAVDGSGSIYIADLGDNRIRLVTNSTGIISTIAGTGTACPSQPCGDGTPATQATLDAPYDILVDFANRVYVADLDDSVVRSFSVGGTISTVAGSYAYGFFGDGSAATSAALAQPAGIGADPAGNLFVTDVAAFRVREVSQLVTTAPTATPSSNPLVFPATILGDNTGTTLTITNNGNGTNLTVSSVAISGTNKSDFTETNNCTTVPPNGGTCTVTVSFTPAAAGTRTATLTITDNASNSPQAVTLSGTGVATLQANPTSRTVSAGGSAEYTITVPSQGFTGNMTLSCPAGLPSGAACTFSPTSVAPGKSSTLTISTTAPSSSMLASQNKRGSAPLYAIWLLLPAMFLSTAGMSAANRKKLISSLLLALAITGVLFLVACGGGSSTSGGGGGGGTPTGGTPSGSYTITVQGVAGSTTATQKVTLTVQ